MKPTEAEMATGTGNPHVPASAADPHFPKAAEKPTSNHAALKNEIKALRVQLGNGQPISMAQLESLETKIEAAG